MKAASSHIDISPTYPVHILGHSMRKEKCKGVHDAIECVLLWLKVQHTPLLFISIDLHGVDSAFTDEIRTRIIAQIPMAKNAIHIGATHTHSGPLINQRDRTKAYDRPYRQACIDRIVKEALRTYKELQDVGEITYTKGTSEGFYGNRDDESGYADQQILCVHFTNTKGQPLGAIVNMACHATVLSPLEEQLSGDLPAALRRKLAAAWQITPLIFIGAAGDMSTRPFRQGNDFHELERVSSGIAAQILAFTDKGTLTLDTPSICSFSYTAQHQEDTAQLQNRLQKQMQQLAAATSFDEKKWLYSEIQDSKERLQHPLTNISFPTEIIRMKDLEILVLPCELSAALGKKLREASNAALCIILGYANDQTTYVVEREQFEKGHGGIVTKLAKGQAEEYIRMICQHMEVEKRKL